MTEIKNNTLALIGMTGCGKSTVGKLLAKKLSARFIDVDDEIIARHGEIKKIFDHLGEAEFRKIEYSVLKEILEGLCGEPAILSCGGGLPTYEPSRILLKEFATALWIRRSAKSVCSDENILNRPPINGDIENYKNLLKKREPIYKDTAQLSFYNIFPKRTASAIFKEVVFSK